MSIRCKGSFVALFVCFEIISTFCFENIGGIENGPSSFRVFCGLREWKQKACLEIQAGYIIRVVSFNPAEPKRSKPVISFFF